MATLERVRPGVRVLELVACYREQIACRGADFDHYAYGVRGTGLVTRVDMTLNAGDHMYIDYGCIYEGYFSDTGFTLAVQEAGAAVCEQYQLLREAHAAGADHAADIHARQHEAGEGVRHGGDRAAAVVAPVQGHVAQGARRAQVERERDRDRLGR